jgi:hypothetical protein
MPKKIIFRSPNQQITPQSNVISTIHSPILKIAYGNVEGLVKDKGFCNVRFKNGFLQKNIRLLSGVFPNKDPLVGSIVYPSDGAEVMVIYPENDLKNGFILPANLDCRDEDVQSNLLDGLDRGLLPGGWEWEYDQETGYFTITNGDVEIIYDDNNLQINSNGNTIIFESSKITINGHLEILQ